MRIKGATPLLEKDDGFARIGDFVELESSTGQKVYVARFSILALCEHGTPFPGEFFPPKQKTVLQRMAFEQQVSCPA
jgi:hypothetical protein